MDLSDLSDLPPFHDRIGTNYAPLAVEVAQIRQLLISPRSEIERIDHEIAQLEARRLRLSAYVSAHETLLAPIRQLPLDIIREIFIACMPKDQNAVMSAQEAPLLLGRICSSWRAIALSTPRLWSSIHIAEPHDTIPQHVREGCLQLVKTWLARSGGLPLSISFHRFTSSGPSPFFDTIESFAPRWKHISLSGQTRIQLTRADVPMLQSIEILDYAGGDDPPETHDFFCGVGVRKISIGTHLDPIRLALPLSQLTSLSLNRPLDPYSVLPRTWNLSSSTALNILAQCHSLRDCAISLSSGADETVDVPSSVELPLLASLRVSVRVRGESGFWQNDPLDRLLLPKLSSFALTGYCRGFVGVPFPTLLSTATKLKNVEIETMLFSKETLGTFMGILPPRVQRLVVRQNIIGPSAPILVDRDFLRLLTQPSEAVDGPGTRFIFPALDTIELVYAAAFSDQELLHFIRARMEIHRLHRIRVKFDRYVEDDILPELQSFIDEFGLDVSIEYRLSRDTYNPRDGLPNRFRAGYM
ncbi:hypothetical protein MVEN_00350500 [Mycena venus]|uniref:F-box domain-containing protein n=1 Tax=Mycena venus TaxID=2733690 RepID=A0A8H6YUB9_9AGAR|nr:hypothetical protein MVEN_00350500 [Mycena venus]